MGKKSSPEIKFIRTIYMIAYAYEVFNNKFLNIANDQEDCIIDDNNNQEVSDILKKINQEINGLETGLQ